MVFLPRNLGNIHFHECFMQSRLLTPDQRISERIKAELLFVVRERAWKKRRAAEGRPVKERSPAKAASASGKSL